MVIVPIAMRPAGLQDVPSRRQLIGARPLEGILRLEEACCRRPARDPGRRRRGPAPRRWAPRHSTRAMDLRRAVDAADLLLDARQVGCAHQVGLVEDHHIGEAHLHRRLLQLLQVLLEVPRVHQRDDGIDHELLLQLVVEEEGLRHRAGIGHARGLDQDVVEALAALEQLAQHADQVAAHGAADAAVAGLEDFLFGADHQLVVDAHLAELVLDHGDALAVVLREDAVEQRGLAGTEEAGQHRDGNACGFAHDRYLFSKSRCTSGSDSRRSASAPHRRRRSGAALRRHRGDGTRASSEVCRGGRVPRITCAGRIHFPHGDRAVAPQPEARAQVPEVLRQLAPVPGATAQATPPGRCATGRSSLPSPRASARRNTAGRGTRAPGCASARCVSAAFRYCSTS